jgi:selenide,water dikinase
VGGHTIEDKEPKYGLSVFGVVHPDRIVRNLGAKPGDDLVLTKPIGTGIIATALKNGLETEESAREVIESMATLNRDACEAMVEVGVNAATDVTGFGLLGHVHEMLNASGCAADLELASVPVFEGARRYAEAGVKPGRTADIVAWASAYTTWQADASQTLWMDVLCDPQTSGGLLMAVPGERADALALALETRGVLAARVGRVHAGDPGAVTVR